MERKKKKRALRISWHCHGVDVDRPVERTRMRASCFFEGRAALWSHSAHCRLVCVCTIINRVRSRSSGVWGRVVIIIYAADYGDGETDRGIDEIFMRANSRRSIVPNRGVVCARTQTCYSGVRDVRNVGARPRHDFGRPGQVFWSDSTPVARLTHPYLNSRKPLVNHAKTLDPVPPISSCGTVVLRLPRIHRDWGLTKTRENTQ